MKLNRRKILSLMGMSPAVLASGPVYAKASGGSVVKTEPGKITALNPRGIPPAIQLIPMAPRPQSLEGKTIYLIDDTFPGADHFLHQIANWFAKNMPSVNTEYRVKAGGLADDDPKLWAEVKAKGNAVIMAIGHCSTCTPATVGHCMTLEKMGIPTAPMVTIAFRDLARTNAANRGMPHERICFTPHPVWGKTDGEMYAYLEGNDPVTGKPLMGEVIAALTAPLTAEESRPGTITPPTGDPAYVDTHDNLQKYYMDNGMTDFLPIVIPTQEKVDAMLKGTSHRPDEIVGKMCPAIGAFPEWSYTVRQVAINAVMAGAEPDYFPVILALAASELPALSSSTNSFATGAIINGPIRDSIRLNYGIGAMGPFAQPNAAIGRAWLLLSKNLGRCGQAGETYMGTLGNALNYNNVVMVENEKDSPWVPFHVQHGFKPEENVVSVFVGLGIQQGQGGAGLGVKPVPNYDDALRYNVGAFAPLFGVLGVLDPLVAKGLVTLGYDTKEKLSAWMVKNATVSVKDAKSSLFGTRWIGAENAKLPDDAQVPRYTKPESYQFVVVGGQTNPYHMVANMSYRSSVSIDKWM